MESRKGIGDSTNTNYKCPECRTSNITIFTVAIATTEYKDGVEGETSVDDIIEEESIACDGCGYSVNLKDDSNGKEKFLK